MSSLPQRGQPEDVLPELKDLVGSFVAQPTVSTFHIGRTGDITRVSRLLDSEFLYPLYVTTQLHHAVQVETELIRAFERHPGCRDGILLDENDAVCDGACYVYVAIWISTS